MAAVILDETARGGGLVGIKDRAPLARFAHLRGKDNWHSQPFMRDDVTFVCSKAIVNTECLERGKEWWQSTIHLWCGYHRTLDHHIHSVSPSCHSESH